MTKALIIIGFLFTLISCSNKSNHDSDIDIKEGTIESNQIFQRFSHEFYQIFHEIKEECFEIGFLDTAFRDSGIFLFSFLNDKENCKIEISLTGYVLTDSLIGMAYLEKDLLAFYNEKQYSCWDKQISLDSLFDKVPNDVFKQGDPDRPPSDPFTWTFLLQEHNDEAKVVLLDKGMY